MYFQILCALLLSFTLAGCEKFRFDNYTLHKIFPENLNQVKLLENLQNDVRFDFWTDPVPSAEFVLVMVSPADRNELSNLLMENKMKSEITMSNVQEHIDKQPVKRYSRNNVRSMTWDSYYVLDDIYAWLDDLVTAYPDTATKIIGGTSYEAREIKGIKISHGSGRRAIFIEGGIHSREWISPSAVCYIISELLTSDDPETMAAARDSDWYIFPVTNPDGYVWTHERFRMWRKNRRPFGSHFGVDLNRNWNNNWLVGGSSTNPALDTYAGPGPFSEPETRSLSNYISTIGDQIDLYLSFHSFSQMLLVPYGNTTDYLGNYNDLVNIGRRAMGALSVRYQTQYVTGNIAETISSNLDVLCERLNRTVVEKARCLLYDAGLGTEFWAEACNCAVYLRNRTVASGLEGKTPFEIWTGTKPDLSHLRIFGSTVMVHVPKQKRLKWEKKSQECILLGYPENVKGYRLYNPITKTIFTSRDVTVIEKENKKSICQLEVEEKKKTEPQDEIKKVEVGCQSSVGDEYTRTLMDSSDESCTQSEYEDADTTTESVSTPVRTGPVLRAPELRKVPDRLGYSSLCTDVNKMDDASGLSLSEALRGPEKEQWKQAMAEELKSFEDNEAWELVNVPKGSSVVKCKWVLKKKYDSENNVRFRARLVAKGYTQKYGVDYEETFAPVVRHTTLRLLFALSVQLGLDISHLDVTTAFLNGYLDEDIYMEKPEGFASPEDVATGGSVDWVKEHLQVPLAYCYELRDRGSSGFLLPENQILPNNEETMDSVLEIIHQAKRFGYMNSATGVTGSLVIMFGLVMVFIS